MTYLRKKMIEDMQLHGLTKSTQNSYLITVKKLSKYYNASPDKLNQNDIRKFFLYLVNEKKLSRSTITLYLCGIKFLYEKTLGKDWMEFKIIKPKKRKKLPVILSISEVKKILDKIKIPSHKMCLTMIYSCGLRVTEGSRLNVSDIDSQRMMVKITNSKNGKDRLVPLPLKTYILLKKYWRKHKPYPWLFPSRVKKIVSRVTLHNIFKEALRESGIKKEVSIHNLRHSFATHLMENGVSIRAIQEILGHSSPRTTFVYTQLTNRIAQHMKLAINKIIDQI